MRYSKIQFSQVRPILAALSASGVNIAPVLQQQGIVEAFDEILDTRELSITDYFRLQRDIAVAMDDLTAQYSSRKLTYKTGQFIVAQVQQTASLSAAMETLVDQFNMMHGGAYNSVRNTDTHVSLIVDDRTFPYRFHENSPLIQFIGDCLLIKTHCLLDSLTHGKATQALRRVRLRRERHASGNTQNQFWAVPIDFSCATYELIYDLDIACKPIPITGQIDLSVEGLFTRVINHLNAHLPSAEAQSMTARTFDLVGDSGISQSDVAVKLGVSPATLRRRLEEEGSSFRALVKKSRFERAASMLQNGYSVPQITDELGYSDIRAFNRAFKQWNGQTPAAFAKTLKLS